MRYKAFIYSVLVIGIITGCSGPDKSGGKEKTFDSASWPIFRGDRNLSGVAGVSIPDSPELLWSFDAGSELISSPVVGFGAIFIGSTDGILFSLDIAGGGKRWSFDTGDDIEASPLLMDGTVYIGNLNGDFYAVDAISGKPKWQYQTDAEIMGSANWATAQDGGKKLVLFGGYDSKMHALNAESGKEVWTYETDYYINGAPATDGRNLVFGGCDEMLYIVSAADGVKTGGVPAGSYIAGSAALVDNRAYLGHYGGSVVCIDVVKQELVWEYRDESAGEYFSSPAVGNDRIYIGSRDRYLHCIDRTTGISVWKFQTRGDVDSSPVLADGKIVFASADGRLYMLEAADGSELWSYEIGASTVSCPAVIDGMIIVGAGDGRVYAFGEKQ